MAHPGSLQRLTRLLRHRWADGRLRRVLTPEVLQRLGQRVAASERRHTGQIRICAEGGLPLSYLWRGASARERAITLFGKLRVWDTADNNGVLVYLLAVLATRNVHTLKQTIRPWPIHRYYLTALFVSRGNYKQKRHVMVKLFTPAATILNVSTPLMTNR